MRIAIVEKADDVMVLSLQPSEKWEADIIMPFLQGDMALEVFRGICKFDKSAVVLIKSERRKTAREGEEEMTEDGISYKTSFERAVDQLATAQAALKAMTEERDNLSQHLETALKAAKHLAEKGGA